MQAYQSAPCPYCGATWNPPGAQVCTNCRNQLPPPQATYAPPGYAPQPGGQSPQGQPAGPGQGQGGYPYAPAPGYPQQGYPQTPGAYPGAPAGYPGQQPYAIPGQGAYPGQQGQPQPYPGYAPPGYGEAAQYGSPYGVDPNYPNYAPAGSASRSTTLRLFGQTVTVPVALPPVVVQYQQAIASAAVGLLVLLIIVFGVLPVVASGQITAANQAITTAVSHQSKVDAGFAAQFAPSPNSNDLNVLKAQESKTYQSISAGLAAVQADEAALKDANQRLDILSYVALSSRTAIANERQRVFAALDGLKAADTALSGGANLGKVMLPLYDVKIDYAQMSNALNRHDLVGAAAPYPDAQQKMQQAVSGAQAPGVPAAITSEVSTLNTLLDNTESLIQAIQNKDAASTKKYSDLVQAGLKTIAGFALPADYEVKAYGSEQKAYDAAIKSLKG